MPAHFRPLAELGMISKRRRDLPHWEVEGATYFLTFRLADAMPSGVLAEFKCRTEAWLRHHGCAHPREVSRLTPSEQREFRQVISRDEEQWLDSGQGSCVLRHSKHRKPLIETLHHFDGMRYVLDEYVIMPNQSISSDVEVGLRFDATLWPARGCRVAPQSGRLRHIRVSEATRSLAPTVHP